MDEEWFGPGEEHYRRVRLGSLPRWRRREPPPADVKPLCHASRLAFRWGPAGLLLGMAVGGAAGLWLAMVDNALYGIGGDNYSGPLSRTAEQDAWVSMRGLGFGLAFVGGLLAVVCGLMGFLWGIVKARSVRSVKPEPEGAERADPGVEDRPRE
jgi:hypothetical protein